MLCTYSTQEIFLQNNLPSSLHQFWGFLALTAHVQHLKNFPIFATHTSNINTIIQELISDY